MHVEAFEPSHAVGATAHEKQSRHQAVLCPGIIDRGGRNWTVLCDEGPVAIGGAIQISDDLVAVWVLFTDLITPSRFVAVYREASDLVTEFLEQGNRVMVHVDPNYPEAVRMAEKLGFQQVGEDQFYDGRKMMRMIAHV